MLAKGITIRLWWVKLEHQPVLPQSTYYTANIIIIIIIIIVVNWDSPDLTKFLFSFLLLFFLNNPISGSICKLPIRSKIYNCTFKNTNKVSIIIIIMITIIIIIIIIIIITVVWSSLVLCYFLGNLSHVSATFLQLRDTTLSARYEQYQGWLTTVHFQKWQVDSTSHTRPLHSSR